MGLFDGGGINWSNPFSDVAKNLSGQDGGFFNPFDQNKPLLNALGLGDLASQADQQFRGAQRWATGAVHSNADNTFGEIFGGNKNRQSMWEEQVKTDAKNAQDKLFADQLSQKQIADLAGSRAGGFSRGMSPGSRLGRGLNYQNQTGDVTDFLGL